MAAVCESNSPPKTITAKLALIVMLLVIFAPQGHFQRAADIPEYRFRVYEGNVHDAPRGNGWEDVAPARALGFGLLLGMPQIDGIPWRNFGGRTAALVRSVLRRGFRHVF